MSKSKRKEGELLGVMTRLAEGDMQALEDLYLSYGDEVATLLTRLLPDDLAGEVDDLRQDVFLTIHKLASKYREQGKLRAWVLRIAANSAKAFRRNARARIRILRARKAHLRFQRVEQERGSGDILVTRLTVRRALSALSPEDREVLILRVVEGLTGDKIASKLGVKERTGWFRLHKARRALTDAL